MRVIFKTLNSSLKIKKPSTVKPQKKKRNNPGKNLREKLKKLKLEKALWEELREELRDEPKTKKKSQRPRIFMKKIRRLSLNRFVKHLTVNFYRNPFLTQKDSKGVLGSSKYMRSKSLFTSRKLSLRLRESYNFPYFKKISKAYFRAYVKKSIKDKARTKKRRHNKKLIPLKYRKRSSQQKLYGYKVFWRGMSGYAKYSQSQSLLPRIRNTRNFSKIQELLCIKAGRITQLSYRGKGIKTLLLPKTLLPKTKKDNKTLNKPRRHHRKLIKRGYSRALSRLWYHQKMTNPANYGKERYKSNTLNTFRFELFKSKNAKFKLYLRPKSYHDKNPKLEFKLKFSNQDSKIRWLFSLHSTALLNRNNKIHTEKEDSKYGRLYFTFLKKFFNRLVSEQVNSANVFSTWRLPWWRQHSSPLFLINSFRVRLRKRKAAVWKVKPGSKVYRTTKLNDLPKIIDTKFLNLNKSKQLKKLFKKKKQSFGPARRRLRLNLNPRFSYKLAAHKISRKFIRFYKRGNKNFYKHGMKFFGRQKNNRFFKKIFLLTRLFTTVNPNSVDATNLLRTVKLLATPKLRYGTFHGFSDRKILYPRDKYSWRGNNSYETLDGGLSRQNPLDERTMRILIRKNLYSTDRVSALKYLHRRSRQILLKRITYLRNPETDKSRLGLVWFTNKTPQNRHRRLTESVTNILYFSFFIRRFSILNKFRYLIFSTHENKLTNDFFINPLLQQLLTSLFNRAPSDLRKNGKTFNTVMLSRRDNKKTFSFRLGGVSAPGELFLSQIRQLFFVEPYARTKNQLKTKSTTVSYPTTNNNITILATQIFEKFLFVEFALNKRLAGLPGSVLGLARLVNQNYDFYSTIFTDFKYTNAYTSDLSWRCNSRTNDAPFRLPTPFDSIFLATQGQSIYRLKGLFYSGDERYESRYTRKYFVKKNLQAVGVSFSLSRHTLASTHLTPLKEVNLLRVDQKREQHVLPKLIWKVRSHFRRLKWSLLRNFFKSTQRFKSPRKKISSWAKKRLLKRWRKIFSRLHSRPTAYGYIYGSLSLKDPRSKKFPSPLPRTSKQLFLGRNISVFSGELKHRLRTYTNYLYKTKFFFKQTHPTGRVNKIKTRSSVYIPERWNRHVFYGTDVDTGLGESTLTRVWSPLKTSQIKNKHIRQKFFRPKISLNVVNFKGYLPCFYKPLPIFDTYLLLATFFYEPLFKLNYSVFPRINLKQPPLKLIYNQLSSDLWFLNKVLRLTTGTFADPTMSFSPGLKVLQTNLLPTNDFRFIISRKIVNFLGEQSFRPNVTPLYYQTFIRFVENVTGKRVLLQYYPFLNQTIDQESITRYKFWLPRLHYYERNLGHRFFLEEALHIMHLSFTLRDITLFGNWLKAMILRISFWKTRSIFRFLRYLMHHYFRYIFSDVQIKGLKIKLKGKISVAGNSRKRTILYRIGKTSHSSVDLRISYESFLVNTFTGVMGFQVWLFY